MSILDEHKNFVDQVTSSASKYNNELLNRFDELETQKVHFARLLTAASGLSGESGEVIDLIKKVVFHGKPWTDEIRSKLIDEAGDVLWYWQNLCMALDAEPEDVIKRNVEKLENRYPNRTFSKERSENRNE